MNGGVGGDGARHQVGRVPPCFGEQSVETGLPLSTFWRMLADGSIRFLFQRFAISSSMLRADPSNTFR